MSQQSQPCPLSVDDSFGPWAGQCRAGFDFTLLFEEAILTIPLLCFFLLLMPWRILKLSKCNVKVIGSPLRYFKSVRQFLCSLLI